MIKNPDNTYNELREKIETLEKENSKLRKENYCQSQAFLEEIAKYSEDGYKPVRFEWLPGPDLLGVPKFKIVYEKE